MNGELKNTWDLKRQEDGMEGIPGRRGSVNQGTRQEHSYILEIEATQISLSIRFV